jgi:hypothetical protein
MIKKKDSPVTVYDELIYSLRMVIYLKLDFNSSYHYIRVK